MAKIDISRTHLTVIIAVVSKESSLTIAVASIIFTAAVASFRQYPANSEDVGHVVPSVTVMSGSTAHSSILILQYMTTFLSMISLLRVFVWYPTLLIMSPLVLRCHCFHFTNPSPPPLFIVIVLHHETKNRDHPSRPFERIDRSVS